MMRFMKIVGRRNKMILTFVRSDVLSTGFCYATNRMGMEVLGGFEKEVSLILRSIAKKSILLV